MEQSREESNHHNRTYNSTEHILAALKTVPAIESSRPAPFWRVWTCIEALLSEHAQQTTTSKGNGSGECGGDEAAAKETTRNDNVMMQEPYRITTIQVAWILNKWAMKWAGQDAWTSVLHKRKLQHEVEESIVAIYHLHQWMMIDKCSSKDSTAKTGPPSTTSLSSPQNQQSFIVVDVCGGKGLFSMLLSYMASEFWYAPPPPPPSTATATNGMQEDIPTPRPSRLLQKIVLLEKAKHVDWSYIHESNERANNQSNNTNNATTTNAGFIPRIEIWADTNLHDTDDLLAKFDTLCSTSIIDSDVETIVLPLALCGIHLCKLLSPSLIDLANGLGAAKNPFLCLSPCCMPRMVTSTATRTTSTTTTSSNQTNNRTITIRLYETTQDRQDRLHHNQQKASRRGRACFLCLGRNHWVRSCPQLNGKSRTEQDAIVAHAMDNIPCFNCGIVGHLKPDCPTVRGAAPFIRRNPPTMDMDISEIRAAKTDKYERYCYLLAHYLEMSSGEHIMCQPIMNSSSEIELSPGFWEPLAKKPKSSSTRNNGFKAKVIESGLTTLGNAAHPPQEGNWNSRRKSIFIVADR